SAGPGSRRLLTSFPTRRSSDLDPTSESGFPSMAHYIKKAFLISENDPYNRFYQFVGPRTINRRFKELGLKHSRITSQFLGPSVEDRKSTRLNSSHVKSCYAVSC